MNQTCLRASLFVVVVAALSAAAGARSHSAQDEETQTLRSVIQNAGFAVPKDLRPSDLDQPVRRRQWHRASPFLYVALAYDDEGDPRDSPAVHIFRISKSGALKRLRVTDYLAGAQWLDFEPPYVFVSAHLSPSAEYSIVIDAASFVVLGGIKGYGYKLFPDGTILFDGNMVHFSDVHQQTIHAFNPRSRKSTEVFPGTYVSPYGALVMKRIDALLERAYQNHRDVPLAKMLAIGFDRYIAHWQASADGLRIVAAVHYYRDRLLPEDFAIFDDAGRHVPVDRDDYEIRVIAVCSRTETGSSKCHEEELAAVARRHKVKLPSDRRDLQDTEKKLVEIMLATK